ncbi:MAG: phosphatase PAP2 family protein [Ruminococcaceae bacterium]|nr:phosphatase PAP2 family protein [Oscillospiraceae bacterium]
MLFGTENFEFGILNKLHDWLHCDFMDSLMVGVSSLGNAGAVWIVIAIVMVSLKRYRKSGFVFAGALILGLIFGNLIMKNIIARPRPCELFEGIDMLIKIPSDPSFPSGHTLASFISAFVLFDVKKILGIIAIVPATLMALSRMYLFVHFPTDILGGIVLALIIYFIVRSFLKRAEAEDYKKAVGE